MDMRVGPGGVQISQSLVFSHSVHSVMSDSLWPRMDCSTPGFPVLRYFPEFVQTHVHWVDDAIHPSHPLSPPNLLALNLSQYQGLFSESALHIRWTEYWSFSFSISPSNKYSGLISFRVEWFGLIAVQGTLRIFSSTTVRKLHFFSIQPSSWSNSHICTWLLEKP